MPAWAQYNLYNEDTQLYISGPGQRSNAIQMLAQALMAVRI